eukprot:2144999-Prymnesium_polylepis.1
MKLLAISRIQSIELDRHSSTFNPPVLRHRQGAAERAKATYGGERDLDAWGALNQLVGWKRQAAQLSTVIVMTLGTAAIVSGSAFRTLWEMVQRDNQYGCLLKLITRGRPVRNIVSRVRIAGGRLSRCAGFRWGCRHGGAHLGGLQEPTVGVVKKSKMKMHRQDRSKDSADKLQRTVCTVQSWVRSRGSRTRHAAIRPARTAKGSYCCRRIEGPSGTIGPYYGA